MNKVVQESTHVNNDIYLFSLPIIRSYNSTTSHNVPSSRGHMWYPIRYYHTYTTSHNVPTYMIGLLEYNSEGSTYVSEVLLYSVLCTLYYFTYRLRT